MNTAQLVEQHIIHSHDIRWRVIDNACFLSKNLYNAANFILRQEYIFKHQYIPYIKLVKQMRFNPDFCALPRKVSQQVLIQLDRNWQSFFAALEEWQNHPEKFQTKPRLPNYKHKIEGRNLLVYTTQALSQPALRKGVVVPSQLDICVKTRQINVNQVRVVPRSTHYVVEIVYTIQFEPANLDPHLIAAIDIGLDNLAAVTSNKPGFRPFLVNGRPLKSINQFYNKRLAEWQSILSKNDELQLRHRLQCFTDKRNRKLRHELHVASRRIIDRLIDENIGKLVIGKNEGWKHKVNLGSKTNQNFVSIPHSRFLNMLTYKAQLAGIEVINTEESYTSKCSFLDMEIVGKHEIYAGKRVKRGLFRAANGQIINADVNGSYNIMRKVAPDAWTCKGVEGAVVHPTRLQYIT